MLSKRNVATFLMLLVGSACASLLDIPNSRAWISKEWKPALEAVWQGIKARNVDPWSTGMVHRPKSEMPGDAVSEAIGYGMIVALYSNDQEYFNRIWDAGEEHLWQGSYYNWRANSSGSVIGTGAASDAEEDIACMLIFADRLVQAGIWQPHTSSQGVTYAERAQTMLNSIWSLMVAQGRYLDPGAGWSGGAFVNPGYFAPAFYRVFARFDSSSTHDWATLIDQCYTSLEVNPGAALGLGPDWMTPQGGFAGSLGYNAFDGGQSMYKDGIRILWRVATDVSWFGDRRGTAFLRKSLDFLDGAGGASAADFFDMQGNEVSCDSMFVFNGGNTQRPRCEHSHLTVSMWATAAVAVGTQQERVKFHEEMLQWYTDGADFFGRASDASAEDTAHNEMYFDQFLAWFGVSMMAGVFSDIVDDLDNPPATGIRYVAARPDESEVSRLGFDAGTGQVVLEHNGRHYRLTGKRIGASSVGHMRLP